MLYKRIGGNTLTEYGFLIGVLALFIVSSLVILGQSINGLFDQTNWSATQYANNSPLGIAGANTTGSTGLSPSSGGLNAPASIMVTGTQLSGLSPVSVNVSSVDGTGIVTSSADTLQALAKQIQNDPNHDPQILALVTELANNGHTAATNMASGLIPYQQAAQSGHSLELLTPEITNTVNASAAFNSTEQQLANYIQAHPNALSPDMVAAIQVASQNAMGILGSLVNLNATGNDMINSSGWYSLAAQSLTVHQDSNTICHNGGDTSSCVQ